MSGGAVVVYWLCWARLASATGPPGSGAVHRGAHPARGAQVALRIGAAVKRNQAAARLLRVAARLEKEAQP